MTLMEKILSGGLMELVILGAFPILFFIGLKHFSQRTKKQAVLFLGAACFPLILGLIGTLLGYHQIGSVVSAATEIPKPAEIKAGYEVAQITTKTGAFLSIPLLLLGFANLLKAKE